MPKYDFCLDESGIANINDYFDSYFVISAVLIENEYADNLSAYFGFLKKRFGILERTNFHASEFFEGRNNYLFTQVNDTEAQRFCLSLGEAIQTMPLTIIAHAIEKNSLRTQLKIPEVYTTTKQKLLVEDTDIAYEIITRKLLFELSSRLTARDAISAVIAESRRESDGIVLRAYLDAREAFRFKHNPVYFGISREAQKRLYSLSFENKYGLRGGLEIADIVSYLIYRHLHGTLGGTEHRGGMYIWEAIQRKLEAPLHSKEKILLTGKDMNRIAGDRVSKISNRIHSGIRSGTLPTLPR